MVYLPGISMLVFLNKKTLQIKEKTDKWKHIKKSLLSLW